MGKKINIKLDNVLKKRGITQRQLKEMVDNKFYDGKDKFRTATISEIYNNQRKSINREHLEIIMDTLEIDDITEIIEIKQS